VVRGAIGVTVSLLDEIVSVTPSNVLVAGGLEAILPSSTGGGTAPTGGGPAGPAGPGTVAATGVTPPGSAGPGSADTDTADDSNSAVAAGSAASLDMARNILTPQTRLVAPYQARIVLRFSVDLTMTA